MFCVCIAWQKDLCLQPLPSLYYVSSSFCDIALGGPWLLTEAPANIIRLGRSGFDVQLKPRLTVTIQASRPPQQLTPLGNIVAI